MERENLKKLHNQAREFTKRMWRNLKPYIEKERDILAHIEGHPPSEEEIRKRLCPEWVALIDREFNIISPRYGFASTSGFFSKPIRAVAPKPYSIGEIHYHPYPKYEPSTDDLMSWANRYLRGESLFCIHTDEKTICYKYKMQPDEIPKELKSLGFALFGMPTRVQEKVKDWFREMIEKGKIEVLE